MFNGINFSERSEAPPVPPKLHGRKTDVKTNNGKFGEKDMNEEREDEHGGHFYNPDLLLENCCLDSKTQLVVIESNDEGNKFVEGLNKGAKKVKELVDKTLAKISHKRRTSSANQGTTVEVPVNANVCNKNNDVNKTQTEGNAENDEENDGKEKIVKKNMLNVKEGVVKGGRKVKEFVKNTKRKLSSISRKASSAGEGDKPGGVTSTDPQMKQHSKLQGLRERMINFFTQISTKLSSIKPRSMGKMSIEVQASHEMEGQMPESVIPHTTKNKAYEGFFGKTNTREKNKHLVVQQGTLQAAKQNKGPFSNAIGYRMVKNFDAEHDESSFDFIGENEKDKSGDIHRKLSINQPLKKTRKSSIFEEDSPLMRKVLNLSLPRKNPKSPQPKINKIEKIIEDQANEDSFSTILMSKKKKELRESVVSKSKAKRSTKKSLLAKSDGSSAKLI